MAIILRCKLLTWPTRGIWTRASRHGRPTRELVGPDAQAAWLVAQHAISLPDDERKCSEILAHAFAVGQVPAWQMAMLLDRIRTFKEQPQAYGTQFDWDDEGKLSPVFIENRDGVDQRRLDLGLKCLEAATKRTRARDAAQSDWQTWRSMEGVWTRGRDGQDGGNTKSAFRPGRRFRMSVVTAFAALQCGAASWVGPPLR